MKKSNKEGMTEEKDRNELAGSLLLYSLCFFHVLSFLSPERCGAYVPDFLLDILNIYLFCSFCECIVNISVFLELVFACMFIIELIV